VGFQRGGYGLPTYDAVWLQCSCQYWGEFCSLYIFRPLIDGSSTFLGNVGNHFIILLTCECRDTAREPEMARSSISVFWNMAYCNLACRYRRFGGACCLHLKVSPIGGGSNKVLRNAGNCLALYIAPYTQKSRVFICIVVNALNQCCINT